MTPDELRDAIMQDIKDGTVILDPIFHKPERQDHRINKSIAVAKELEEATQSIINAHKLYQEQGFIVELRFDSSTGLISKWILKNRFPKRIKDEGNGLNNVAAVKTVSGRSKPARDGRMKTSHFEVGVALGAAGAADQRDEPTQREPATFHRHAVGPGLVRTQGRP